MLLVSEIDPNAGTLSVGFSSSKWVVSHIVCCESLLETYVLHKYYWSWSSQLSARQYNTYVFYVWFFPQFWISVHNTCQFFFLKNLFRFHQCFLMIKIPSLKHSLIVWAGILLTGQAYIKAAGVAHKSSVSFMIVLVGWY